MYRSFYVSKFVALVALVGMLVAPNAIQAISIGVNLTSQSGIPNTGDNRARGGVYDDLSPGGSNFNAAAVAGAAGYAQSNWNHFIGDWSGAGGNDGAHTALVDSNGAAVTNLSPFFGTDRVKFDSANTYTSGIGNANPNATLMHGYLDDGGNNQPYMEFDVKYDGEAGADGIDSYDVVLYMHGDGANSGVGRYWLEDFSGAVLTDQIGIRSNDYTGTFIEAGIFGPTGAPQNVDVQNGNYIVFSGITADTIRVRSAGNGDPEDFGRGPLNAVQLISNGDNSVPEPATATLALLGLGGLMMRRRRSA